MKIARFMINATEHYAVVEGEDIFEINTDPYAPGFDLSQIKKGQSYCLGDVRLLAPCSPTKIVAVGLNYRAHAKEFNKEIPEEPMIFMKPPSAVIGPGDDIVYPSHMSHRVDFEGELAVVVAREARDVAYAEANDYILGYTCINDVTARDLQGRDKQFARAKGFDTFAPIGPWVETSLDPDDVRIETYLNSQKKQSTSTEDMIFSVRELFSFISCVMTLNAGDVIATGTPSGVGKMKPGDRVEVTIEGIGALTNTVVARD